jgi:hypothetical protein
LGVNPVILSNAQETIISKDSLINDSYHLSENEEVVSRLIEGLEAEIYKSGFMIPNPTPKGQKRVILFSFSITILSLIM